MRLIDADELKKDFNLNFGGVIHAVAAAEIIDRQPTIGPRTRGPGRTGYARDQKFREEN